MKAFVNKDIHFVPYDSEVTANHPQPYYEENASHSVEEDVDERRGDQHDGRYGRGGLVMRMNSEISGRVDGGPTYLDRNHHVDDKNRYGHYKQECNKEDDVDDTCAC